MSDDSDTRSDDTVDEEHLPRGETPKGGRTRGVPDHEPVPPSHGTLTRLIGQDAVRYFLATLLILSFLTVFIIVESLVASVVCIPETLSAATEIALNAEGGSTSAITSQLQDRYISCSIGMALHPVVFIISLVLSVVASFPVYSMLQAIERGELLRSVL